jgi:hypothetical protein
MKKNLAVFGCAVLFLLLNVPTPARAQAQAPLPLGDVTGVNELPTCPQGYYAGALCYEATVSCPNALDIPVTYGLVNATGVPRGMVVFFNGSGGITPYGGTNRGRSYAETYLQAGYQIVQLAWETDWEDTGIAGGRSVKTAACRPATLLNYFHQTLYQGDGGMCAQGASAGSAGLAYTLAWYGGASYLDKVELLSGPVLSDIEQGCATPKTPATMVCPNGQQGCNGEEWQDKPQYVQGAQNAVTGWTGQSCQPKTQTAPTVNSAWKAMSIVDGTRNATFDYPQTAMAAWLCSNSVNNSAAEGQIFYQQFTTPTQTAAFSVTRIDNCGGSEGVEAGTTPQGENGFIAISSDMIDPVAGCLKRH